MKAFIFITLLLLHLATCHLQFDKVAEKVQSGLKHLKEKAVSKLHRLTADLHKQHKHVPVPYAKHYVKEHYTRKTPFVIDPYQIERLKHYFEPPHKPVTYHIPHYP
ncbi:uncharacterized protein LOC123703185 isoform X1 [Colias croceus]|uniref:uncharacterized protein LOC123703185 isoform X1 n=1 Tax=Colias crocea TaxID=72248 RepID=UPI001E27C54E|nr:uncharacterized protein LOC123703185 isoform X1 [Colias croceus]